ncbi:hypothetical protein MIND_01259300 [Mycena indigotica]|uniref:Uncharacterized protein n=1 Tax=Mycena indigotica TaxID=2126181 RepID=A0A8H6S339_9AGAR|nr:uncharacterized protein MIND_01259300 [Mycena indigotica]KAF7291161.1 hypothetical protein MIND_01259300 [Mycena indigotica]
MRQVEFRGSLRTSDVLQHCFARCSPTVTSISLMEIKIQPLLLVGNSFAMGNLDQISPTELILGGSALQWLTSPSSPFVWSRLTTLAIASTDFAKLEVSPLNVLFSSIQRLHVYQLLGYNLSAISRTFAKVMEAAILRVLELTVHHDRLLALEIFLSLCHTFQMHTLVIHIGSFQVHDDWLQMIRDKVDNETEKWFMEQRLRRLEIELTGPFLPSRSRSALARLEECFPRSKAIAPEGVHLSRVVDLEDEDEDGEV